MPKLLEKSFVLPDNSARAESTHAPVAKLDKAPVYETGDYRFESCRVRISFFR